MKAADEHSEPLPVGPRSRTKDELDFGLFAAASLGVVAVLFSVPYFATHDGPQHLYLGHLSNHFGDPGAPYPDFYRPTNALPALGFSLLYAPFAELASWRTAQAAVLTVIALSWGWGFSLLVRAVDPRRFVIGLLGFALAFSWVLEMGFFSYVMSLGVGFGTIALATSVEHWQLKHRVFIAGLLLVQAVFHVFGALAVGVFLLALVIARAPRRARARELGALGLMGLPLALLVAYAAGWFGGAKALPETPLEAPFSFWDRVLLLRGTFAGGPWWRGWPPVLLALLGIGTGIQRWTKGAARPAEKALLCTSTAALATAVLAPFHLAAWEFFAPRFTPVGVMLALPLLPLETLGRPLEQRTAKLALVTFTAASLLWAAHFARGVYRDCEAAFAGLARPIHQNGLRLPLILDPTCGREQSLYSDPFPFFEPLFNVGALYAIEQGGIVPYTFTSVPQLHSFVLTDEAKKKRLPPAPERRLFWSVYRDPRAKSDVSRRLAFTTRLAAYGAAFDDVLLYGPEEERDVLLARGYVSKFHEGEMSILSFVGCPLSLAIASSAPPPAFVRVQYTWPPAETKFQASPIPPAAFSRGGPVSFPIPSSPCGPVRFVVFSDAGGRGRPSPGDWRCAGTDADGGLTVDVSPAHTRAECRLEPPP